MDDDDASGIAGRRADRPHPWAESWPRRTDATLVAVADASQEAATSLAAGTGAATATAEAILSDPGIDAVLICTPTDTHADLIEAAVSAGKAVFCEKPVDLDAGRIRRCLETVARSGKPLMIGFNRRFDPNFAALERRLRAGEAGEIEIVSVISRDPAPPPVDYVKRSGGLFRDMMIHDFDMARFLLAEEPVEVFALGSALVDPAIGRGRRRRYRRRADEDGLGPDRADLEFAPRHLRL